MIFEHRDPANLDERGFIVDVVQDSEFQHATVISSIKGAVRGNHYHKETVQSVFVLLGKVMVSWRVPGGGVEHRILAPGDLVTHPPLERHAVTALEDSSFLVLTRGPRGGDHYESDTFRENV